MTSIDDQDNPNEGSSPSGETLPEVADSVPESDASTDSRPPDNTAEAPENQEKAAPEAPPAGPPADPLDERIARRTRDLKELMVDKESHQLTFIYGKVPKPYYDAWKVEANEIFTLMVSLKHRRAKTPKKAG